MDYNDFWEMQRCFCCVKEEMEQVFAPFAAANDVTGGQLKVLLALQHQNSQTVSSLARALCMADANMSTQVKRLGEKGLVQRRRHEEDERQVHVSLTAEGRKLSGDFMAYCSRHLNVLLARMTEEEQEAIRKGLLALQRVLNRRESAAPPGKTVAESNLRVRVYKENRE